MGVFRAGVALASVQPHDAIMMTSRHGLMLSSLTRVIKKSCSAANGRRVSRQTGRINCKRNDVTYRTNRVKCYDVTGGLE